MDIEGLSIQTMLKFMNEGFINQFADIYHLSEHEEAITAMEGFGQKSFDNMIKAIEKSRNCELDRFIHALGIPNVGRKTARDLAAQFGCIEKLAAASEEELTALDDVGEIVAKSILDFFADEGNRQELGRLLAAGVTPNVREAVSEGPLSGMTVVVTGTLSQMTRQQAEQAVRDAGGTAGSSVSKKTNLVVAGESAGSKLEKAGKLGIKVIGEEEFRKMLGL